MTVAETRSSAAKAGTYEGGREAGSVIAKAHRYWRRRTIIFSILAIFLVWQVVAHSFAAYFAEIAPGTALWLQPRQSSALVNLADRTLNASKDTERDSTDAAEQTGRPENAPKTTTYTSGTAKYYQNLNQAFSAFESLDQNRSVTRPFLPPNAAAVRSWAETALLNAPLDARALRILGQLAEASADDAGAAKFMDAAAQLSLHESLAVLWLLQKSAEAKNDKRTIYYADVLLRTRPEFGGYVQPILAHIAEDGRSADLLKQILAGNPPWRGQFFAALPQNVTDMRTPLEFLSALRTTSAPPTAAEIGSYVNFLIGRKLYDLAYYTWLQFLPAADLRNAGLLFNGSFKGKPSGLPFDWQITQGSGVTIDIVPKPDGNGEQTLQVDFELGRVDYHSVTELIMLAPGTYEFRGQYKGELVGPRGLKWRIVCAGGAAAPLGESAMILGKTANWNDIAFNFTVPPADCRAQDVRLDFDARMPSEQFASGSVLFDALQILRLTNPPS